MRKDIITCICSCAVYIQTKNVTYVSRQLVHSWLLLVPVAIISGDIWIPGNIVSPTGANCLLDYMCDMTQFLCSVAMSHVNSAKLAQTFMEGVLLKFGICIVIVVEDNTKFMAVFKAMAKLLNVRLNYVLKRNHKAIGVERYHTFLNHAQTNIGAVREIHRCFVEVGVILSYAWNTIYFMIQISFVVS